jgi:hypothetical protein
LLRSWGAGIAVSAPDWRSHQARHSWRIAPVRRSRTLRNPNRTLDAGVFQLPVR